MAVGVSVPLGVGWLLAILLVLADMSELPMGERGGRGWAPTPLTEDCLECSRLVDGGDSGDATDGGEGDEREDGDADNDAPAPISSPSLPLPLRLGGVTLRLRAGGGSEEDRDRVKYTTFARDPPMSTAMCETLSTWFGR